MNNCNRAIARFGVEAEADEKNKRSKA